MFSRVLIILLIYTHFYCACKGREIEVGEASGIMTTVLLYLLQKELVELREREARAAEEKETLEREIREKEASLRPSRMTNRKC